jgi:hypothetical protein
MGKFISDLVKILREWTAITLSSLIFKSEQHAQNQLLFGDLQSVAPKLIQIKDQVRSWI